MARLRSSFKFWLQILASNSGFKFWLQILASNSGFKFWLQILASDSGKDFGAKWNLKAAGHALLPTETNLSLRKDNARLCASN